MELITETDIYYPSIDNDGKYVDRIPNFINIKGGLKCQCGTRKDKIYSNYAIFSQHLKRKMHQKWMESINLNRENYLVENSKLKDVIKQQRIHIAELEKTLNKRSLTIDYLSHELHKVNIIEGNNEISNNSINDLLNFD
jgi:inner membrane protein involved in colicin E2 resistance